MDILRTQPDNRKRDKHGNPMVTEDEDPVLFKIQQKQNSEESKREKNYNLAIWISLFLVLLAVLFVLGFFLWFLSFEYSVVTLLLLIASILYFKL